MRHIRLAISLALVLGFVGATGVSARSQVIAKPPATAVFDKTLPLGDAAFLLLYNERSTQLKDQISGAVSADDPRTCWMDVPAGYPWSGPYVDNINPIDAAHRASAVFTQVTQSGGCMSQPCFLGKYHGDLTVASISIPKTGAANVAYIIDNSGQGTGNPASFNIYLNSPGFPGCVGETLRNAAGTIVTGSNHEYAFNGTPVIVHVRVMHASGGTDIWCNLDASGNVDSTMRKVVNYPTVDVAATLGPNPTVGMNGLGIWGTLGPKGSPAGYFEFGVWPRAWADAEVQGFRTNPFSMMR